VALLGYCKECLADIHEDSEIEDYKGVYECPKCYYPNTIGDLWQEKQESELK
jgi:hypothetical protein